LKRYRQFAWILVISLLCSTLSFFTVQAQEVQVWTESSYINVFRDDRKSDKSGSSIDLVMAKNEFESAQICIRMPVDFTILEVTATDLRCGSEILKKENITYNFVEYFYFGKNTESLNKMTAVRFGQDYYPDALSNELSVKVKKDTTQPIWITVYTPKETVKGLYKGEIVVKTTQGDYTVDLSVEVNDTVIPDSDQAAYEILMWQLIIGSGFGKTTADSHTNDPIVRNYKFERWTPRWWELVEDIALKMKSHRLNVLFVQTVQLLIDGGSTLDEDGKYHFNWSKFDEYIEFFMEKGGVKSLAGYMMTTAGSQVNVILRNGNGVSITDSVSIQSKEADNWFVQYIPALYEHLKEKGWLHIWVQNLRDEPSNGEDRADYAKLMEYMRTYAPDMKTGDPHTTMTAGSFLISEDVDILIPLLNLYDENKSIYKKALTGDKKLWTYTCVVPGGNYLNRFIDKPVWQGRSIAWFNYANDAVGYLHWGLMAWYRPITDFANGDTSSIFPDSKNNKVKTSIRLAALRDGAEDYELLKILEKSDKETAKELAQRIASKGNMYNKSPEEMIKIRNMLVRAAASVPDAIPAMKSIELSSYELTLAVGDVHRIEYKVFPEDTFFSDIQMETDNTEVIKLWDTGHVEALKEGKAVVVFSGKKNPDVKAVCHVTVVERREETEEEPKEETSIEAPVSEETEPTQEEGKQKSNGIFVLAVAAAFAFGGLIIAVLSKRKGS
jgi:hypothetical protein